MAGIPHLRAHPPTNTINTPTAPIAPQFRIVQTFTGQKIEAIVPGHGGPVGSIELRRLDLRKAELVNLRVAPEHRRRHIGSGLVQRAIQAARAQGVASISLEARPAPAAAPITGLMSLYGKLGFRNGGTSPRGNPIMLMGPWAPAVHSPRARVAQPALLPKRVLSPKPHGKHLSGATVQRMLASGSGGTGPGQGGGGKQPPDLPPEMWEQIKPHYVKARSTSGCPICGQNCTGGGVKTCTGCLQPHHQSCLDQEAGVGPGTYVEAYFCHSCGRQLP